MLNGLLDLGIWGLVGITLLLTHVTIAAVTIYLHRCQAHNALTLHPAASHFFRFWLWLTTGMVTREWVAVHRKHHAKVETVDDPHSPQVEGIWKVLFGGVALYRRAAKDEAVLKKYGKGTPDDWIDRNLYRRYPGLGLVIMAALDILLFGLPGLLVFLVQIAWIPFWAAGVINGLGHYWGYRNCETPDASRNLAPIGLLIGGEELHNNHHAYAQSARLSNRWWELDIGWIYIRILALLGLARVRRVAPLIHVGPARPVIDRETLKAVVRDRYRVLALYSANVVRPILRAEKRTSRKSDRKRFRGIRKLMVRDDVRKDDRARALLDEVFAFNQRLETVYRFKMQLKALWSSTADDGARRLEGLKTWCAEAEQSGIGVLEDFALLLRGYRMKSG